MIQVICLIRDGDESAYRQEVEQLVHWCSWNNLELNMLKTVEVILDFRKRSPVMPPIAMKNSSMSAAETFRFLGSIISWDLKWTLKINTIIKKAQQRMYLLRQLRKVNLPWFCCSSELPSLSVLVRPTNMTGTDYSGQSGLQRKSLVSNCPGLRTSKPLQSGGRRHHCRSISPRTQPVWTVDLWQALHLAAGQQKQRNCFCSQAITDKITRCLKRLFSYRLSQSSLQISTS